MQIKNLSTDEAKAMKTRFLTTDRRPSDAEHKFRFLPRQRSGGALVLALVLACGFAAAAITLPDTAWVRRYDGSAHSYDYIAASAVDRWGNVYVTGYTTSTGSDEDFLTIKYRPNGDTAWARTYNGPGNGIDVARSVAVNNSGNVFVTGESRGSGTGFDFATIKYDSLGTSLWVSRFNSPGDTDDLYPKLALDQAGDCYVAGKTVTAGSGADYLTVKYSPDGDTLWARRYLTQSSDDCEPTAIAVDSAGNAYVTGTDWTIAQLATVKYDASGIRYWANQRPGWANGIALGSSGTLYVTGGYNSPAGAQDFLTVAYDTASGETTWAATYDGPAHDNDGATAIAVGASGRIYVTGYSTRDTVNWNQDFLTIAYQPTGETLGVRRVLGPHPGGADVAEAIALDSAENMYVCGYGVDSAGNTTLMAVSYGDGGVQRGLARYVGSAGSGGEWTTVNTFGSNAVYLAGCSHGSGTWSDWTVAKYGPFLGITGSGQSFGRVFASGATIVHGVLSLPSVECPARSVLLDASGRAVAQLAPGANDVTRLAPGVYFVRQTTSNGTSTRKVVFE